MKKNSDLGDNVCRYDEPVTGLTHIKFCDEGKYCVGLTSRIAGSDIKYTCQNMTTKISLKSIDDSCNSDFECETNLYCKKGATANKCSLFSSCNTDYSVFQYNTGSWGCKKDKHKDYTYYRYFNDQTEGNNEYGYDPGYLKIRGKLSVKTENGNYVVEKIEESTIGSVPDGEFVYDEMACESGFALYFYGNKELEDPFSGTTGSSNHKMFKKCVTVNSIEMLDNDYCRITYDGDKVYNVAQLELDSRKKFSYTFRDTDNIATSYSGTIDGTELCQEYLMTKLEMFKRYKDRLKEKINDCSYKDNYNELKTCNDDLLRKWYHFYQYPKDYLLYYDEDEDDHEIANYLIQSEFSLYQISEFINVKKIIMFLLFLFAL